MPKVVTQDDIIGRFKGVHGDRYDYSKTVYNGSKQKVVQNSTKYVIILA